MAFASKLTVLSEWSISKVIRSPEENVSTTSKAIPLKFAYPSGVVERSKTYVDEPSDSPKNDKSR